jgi:hypothetical protein
MSLRFACDWLVIGPVAISAASLTGAKFFVTVL